MSWKSFHDKTSNSLTVDRVVITKRMMRLQTIVTKSASSDNLVEQAPKVIEIMVGCAEGDFVSDSTTEDEIKAMRKAGTYEGCYAGGNQQRDCSVPC